tara:strand:- start:1387 stop:1491 length:105 start_codon:yes stop_codon:yes gene_type:complete
MVAVEFAGKVAFVDQSAVFGVNEMVFVEREEVAV